jgi:glycosyltransferase involved in cell wall biosynthesis
LIIVGDGPQESNLKMLASDLNLTERIHFLGYRTDIVDLMRSADIFLQPSWANEGISQSLLQACATGLPVIAGNISGLNELIKNGVNGLLVNPGDSDDLRSKIEFLLNSEDGSKKIGLQARQVVLDRHSMDSMANQMMQICNKILQE